MPPKKPARRKPPTRTAARATVFYFEDADREALEQLAEQRRESRGDPTPNLTGTVRDLIRAARRATDTPAN